MGRHVRGGHVKRLGHDLLRHAHSVGLGVQINFRLQDGVLFRRSPVFIGECAVLDLVHVVPIRDDIGLNEIHQLLVAGRENFVARLSHEESWVADT